MALVADSGALYALYDRRDRAHRAVRNVVASEDGVIVIPSPILGEVDYLLRVRLGPDAEIRFLEGVERGAFTVEPFTVADASACRNLLERYRDLDLGLADASVVVIAERLGLRRILTVDQRDFRAVRDSRGLPFVLLPADKQR